MTRVMPASSAVRDDEPESPDVDGVMTMSDGTGLMVYLLPALLLVVVAGVGVALLIETIRRVRSKARSPADDQVAQRPSEQNSPTVDVYALALEKMKEGASVAEVEELLVEHGLSGEKAASVAETAAESKAFDDLVDGKRKMLFGMLCFIVGIVVTAVTYRIAGKGETYIVAWGAMLYGAYLIIRGIGRWGKARASQRWIQEQADEETDRYQ